MAVYVDDMNATFGRMKMCHMLADTTEELLTMADKIGVQRKWIQHAWTIKEHFDICLSKKSAALAAGAQALRDERDSQQRVAIKSMEELAALRARVVVVPERDARRMDTEYPEGWNDCLDELARLNGKTVSEGLLRGMGAFAQEIISGALEGGKFDGADLQESAERHGLIAKQVMNEPCRGPEEYCACAWSTSFPTECYRITAELRALLNQDKENGNG